MMNQSAMLRGYYSYLVVTFPLLYLGFSIYNSNKTLAVASLEISKSANVTSINSGETFIYTINYRCASLTEDCLGTVITDPLPPEVEFVAVYGSAHTTNEVYNGGTHTVTFDFIATLLSGTVGQVQIEVQFPNGITPNASVASNTATIDASNAPTVLSNTVDVSAIATSKVNTVKYLDGGGVPDELSVYTIEFCNIDDGVVETGTLNQTNVTVIDTIPPGAIFVDAGWPGVYDPVSNAVTWVYPTIEPGQCRWSDLTIRYPTPTFSVGDPVTNEAYITTTPVGESPNTILEVRTTILESPNIVIGIAKTNTQSSLYPGETGTYSIDWWNDSNIEIKDFTIIDTIPTGLEIQQIGLGAHYINTVYDPDSMKLTILYQTNLNTSWTATPNSPFGIEDGSSGLKEDVATFGLATGEFITMVKWQFGPDPMLVSSGAWVDMVLDYQVMMNATAGTLTNCIAATDSLGAVNIYEWSDYCVDLNILSTISGANLNPVKSMDPNTPLNPGDIRTFQLAVRNEWGAGDSLGNPIVYDLLPEGITYETGSWYLPGWGNTTGFPDPTFTHVIDYNGTGRELVKWEWSGANSIEIPPGDRVVVSFEVKFPDILTAGSPSFYNYMWVQGDNIGNCLETSAADIYDLDGDSDFTETICQDAKSIHVNSIVSIESEKLVKGQLDANWTKYPDIGNTVPGGIADYQLNVRNLGTVPMNDIVIIDILPHENDSSVVTLLPRESRWAPNLVGQVSAPAGVTVYYSTETNPCRSIEGIVPTGPPDCMPANWLISSPLDITTVRSLKFDFGTTILLPGDTMILEWPMRAPVNALDSIGVSPDSTAWNSFGFIASRQDNGSTLLPSEPIKVGIDIEPLTPGVYGDFVWMDDDMDGIQDIGEPGLDGVRVELFKDNGDGINNPALDTFINFTVTANGGFYLFPNIPPGDYYALFFKPPPLAISPIDVGGDDNLDSDGVLTTYNGFEVIILPVTTINGTYSYQWDQGFVPSMVSALGNYVWNDLNNDGIQNEPLSEGINGLVVNLYDNANPGVIFDSYISRNDPFGNPGYYLFDNFSPGDYFLEFILPTGVSYTSSGPTGISDPTDSDINVLTGRTEIITLVTGQYDSTWDGGFILPLNEICDNNFDDDQDGLIDCLDPDCDCCKAQAPTISKN